MGHHNASLTNDTEEGVTTNIAPFLWLHVEGSTSSTTASSSASISLSSTTASGSCSGDFGSYGLGVQQNKTYSFGIITLQPGQTVSSSGSYSISVNGGVGEL